LKAINISWIILFLVISFLFNVDSMPLKVTAKDEMLIKIAIKSKLDIENLYRKGANIISDFDNFVLVRSDENSTEYLKESGLNYIVLDDIVANRSYYYVWPLDNEAERAVSLYGKILLKRGNFFIIRFDDLTNLKQLMQFRVELTRISLKPIQINKKVTKFPSITHNSTVQEIVNRVNSDSVLGFVRRLSNFQTRYSFTDSCRASADYIKFQFEAYGLDSVYFQEFDSTYAPNVIGIKQGTLYPDSIYTVLCGHYDCTSQNPYSFAPGADDNGSGATSVLEAVRVMQGNNFEKSLRFIAFCGEEQGLLGSNYYASQVHNQGDSIFGVINIDMVAYSLPNRDSASIIGKPSNPNCATLVDYFITCADSYTLLKTQRQIIDRPRSDHASFNQYGFSAIHCRENLNITNPYYHTTGDSIGGGFNALNLCTEVIKAAVATVTSLAVPVGAGITEAKASLTAFRVTPNPSSKIIKVEFIPSNNKSEIKIFDIMGRVKKRLIINRNLGSVNIDVTELKSGIYFIELKNSGNRLNNKLIIR
jgi:aminopeptidase YwaD